MATPTFSARFSPTNSVVVTGTSWDVAATVADGTGEFSGTDVATGDVVFLDCFASLAAANSIGRYRVSQVNSSGVSLVNVRLAWDDDGLVVDPAEVLGSLGFISRSSTTDRFAWHAAPTLHNFPDYVVQYARNKELRTTLDGRLGLSAGLFVDVTLTPIQILNLHTTPVQLLSAPGVLGKYHVIDSVEVRMPFNSVAYVNGSDLYVDFQTTPDSNTTIDGGVLRSVTTATRFATPANPLPDVVNLPINQSIMLSTPTAFTAGDSSLTVRLRFKTFTALT